MLNANDYQNIRDERERTVKILFKDYKTLSASMRQQLLELGFEITEEGKHYRLTYYGDGRLIRLLRLEVTGVREKTLHL